MRMEASRGVIVIPASAPPATGREAVLTAWRPCPKQAWFREDGVRGPLLMLAGIGLFGLLDANSMCGCPLRVKAKDTA